MVSSWIFIFKNRAGISSYSFSCRPQHTVSPLPLTVVDSHICAPVTEMAVMAGLRQFLELHLGFEFSLIRYIDSGVLI